MSSLKLSKQLREITKNYRFVKDSEGMSPARVYQLTGRDEILYLKISDSRYHGTTYDVEREKDMMLWLTGKLPVPDVLHFEQYENENFLLMRAVRGEAGCAYYEKRRDPEQMIRIYSEGIRLFQSVSIADCPFTSDVATRLNELDFLLSNNLADIDPENWEDDTPFQDPQDLYAFLKTHQPAEDFVFSHGDFGDSNIFIANNHISGVIDLGRSGKADKWYDIAFCVRSIQNDLGNKPDYLDLFFNQLGIEPNWDKIRYFILLDELF